MKVKEEHRDLTILNILLGDDRINKKTDFQQTSSDPNKRK
jgi:hypothetical protein